MDRFFLDDVTPAVVSYKDKMKVLKKRKEEEFQTQNDTDRTKRFDYLLQQTEIFSHFVSTGDVGNGMKRLQKLRFYQTKILLFLSFI